MVIIGWIFPRGYTEPIALVNNASYILLSVIQLQKNGMGVHCPPERTICLLTIICDDAEQVDMDFEQLSPTNLYFVDIRMLLLQHSSCIGYFWSFCAATIRYYNCTACFTSHVSLDFYRLISRGVSPPWDLSVIDGIGY